MARETGIRAEIVAVGSELLGADRIDTDSLYLTGELNRRGIAVRRKHVVGDRRADLAETFREALGRADLLIVTGGLGPTEDDLTREAAAEALGVGLERSAALVERLRAYFARRGAAMPERNTKQADVLAGAESLANGWGTAPGQWLERDGRALVLLPGPPRELRPLFAEQVAPRLESWLRRQLGREPEPIVMIRLGIADMGESAVDEVAAPIYSAFDGIETTILAARPGEIELHLRAPASAEPRLHELRDRLQAALGLAVYTTQGLALEAVVGEQLQRAGQTLAVAESCTGGLLGARLTAPAGASRFFQGGVISYSNDAKRALLGVAPETLARHGAVSGAAAGEMAQGARRALATDWALAITGIAGPGGGSEAKPVGTVFIGLAGGAGVEVIERRLAGERERIRQWSATIALDRLRRALAGAAA